VEKFVNKDLI